MYQTKNIDVVMYALSVTINPKVDDVFMFLDNVDAMTSESQDILVNFDCEYIEPLSEFMVIRVKFAQGGKEIGCVSGLWHEEDLTELCEALQHECDMAREVAKEC